MKKSYSRGFIQIRNTEKLTVLILCALPLLTIVSIYGQSKGNAGSVCLAPVEPPNDREKNLSNPSGGNRIQNYEIQIDAKTKIKVSTTDSEKVSGLSDNKRHLVKIFGDGKTVESFKFSFNDYSSGKLCLFFNPLYETWSL